MKSKNRSKSPNRYIAISLYRTPYQHSKMSPQKRIKMFSTRSSVGKTIRVVQLKPSEGRVLYDTTFRKLHYMKGDLPKQASDIFVARDSKNTTHAILAVRHNCHPNAHIVSRWVSRTPGYGNPLLIAVAKKYTERKQRFSLATKKECVAQKLRSSCMWAEGVYNKKSRLFSFSFVV